MTSKVERYTQSIPGNGVIALSPANYLFLETASLAVTLKFQGGGKVAQIGGVTAGVLHGRVEQWKRAVIEGTPGTVVSWYYGDADLREDVTDFRSQLIGGVTTTADSPAGTLADTAPVSAPTGAQTAIVPQNLARRRVTLSVLSTAAPNALVFFRRTGGAQNLGEVQAGLSYEFRGTYGVDVRNDSGSAISFMIEEES